MSKKSGIFAGIDLGTNNSCIAVYKYDKVEVLAGADGSRITPSWVYIGNNNKIYVGKSAKNYGNRKPERLLYDSKRLLGIKGHEPLCELYKLYKYEWTFEITRDPESGYCNYKIDGCIYTPEQISAEILKKLVSYVRDDVEGVVLTVPAYFSSDQKKKILEAAEMAGLEVLQLICEPTAAAIAYGMEHSYINGETLLVFDMGGGTFDIAFIKNINSKDFTFIALGGDSHLGGRDFDDVIIKWMLQQLKEQVGKVELTPRKKHKMNEMAKETKEALSQAEDAVLQLTEIHSDAKDVIITRQQFEKLSEDLMKKVKECIVSTLKCRALNQQEINHVLFVGGASKMPMVSKLLKEFFNKAKFSKTVNAEEIVAHGAARLAAIVGDKSENIYVGISALDKNEAEIMIFNAVNFKQHAYSRKDFCNNPKNLISIFEELKSKIGEEMINLDKICFCLDENYGNNSRKTLIKIALEYGFNNAYIIDYNTSQFVEAMTYSNDIPKNDVTIWLFNGNLWNVWQIVDNKASFIAELDKNFLREENFTKVIEKYKTENDVLLFKGQIFDITTLITKFPKALYFTYPSQSSKNATILYCEMMAKHDIEINNVYINEMILKAGGQELIQMDKRSPLPLKKVILHETRTANTILTVSQNNFQQQQFVLPNPSNYLIELTVDEHGIYEIKAFEEIALQPLTAENNPTAEFPKSYNFPQKIIENDRSICAVGIDFGNTNCLVAVNRNNGIEMIPLGNTSERELLSYVSYDEMNEKCGKVVVGRLLWHSKSTVYDFKKIIGKKFTDIEIDENWPFKLINNHLLPKIEVHTFNGEMNKIVETQKDPDEVLAELFKYMKKMCEEYQGRHLIETVVTVPLYFNEKQMAAVKSAAFIAGWVRIHLLPDPIAAVFAYFDMGSITKDSTILTFDLGGSSLQICLLRIDGNEIQIIGHNEDIQIGGKSFDIIIKNYVQNRLKQFHEHLNFENKQHKFDLECEEAKKDLFSMTQREYIYDDIQQNVNKAVVPIDYEECEKLSQPLLKRIQENINTALNKVNLNHDEVDMVLQVGGGSRMQIIKELLIQAFPKAEQCCHLYPEEVVARGATQYAYELIFSSQI